MLRSHCAISVSPTLTVKTTMPVQIIFHVGVRKRRLLIPAGCPGSLARLLRDCWAEAPAERPTFRAIQQTLARMSFDDQS
jgi:hypothetical protein